MNASVIVPAHDEGAVIGRLLSVLHGVHAEVVVVCNGCSDDTADVARTAMPQARVAELAEASKAAALRLGDDLARHGRRVYLDADVEITAADVDRLLAALDQPGVLAVAPERRLDLVGSSWPVRAYYAVWQELPVVRTGLFGRGVVAVAEQAWESVRRSVDLMADDLALSAAFPPPVSRIVSDATVTVHAPRTLADLLRRRERAVTGNHQLRTQDGQPDPPASTGAADLVSVLRRRPALVPHAVVFAAVTVLARRRAARRIRAGDFTTWQRDQSSRSPG